MSDENVKAMLRIFSTVTYTVAPTGEEPFRFAGVLLGESSSAPPADSPRREKNPAAKRWYTLRAFESITDPPKFVGVIEFHSAFPNEPPQTFAHVAADRGALVAWLRAFDPCNPSVWNWSPWNKQGAEERVKQVKDAISAWYRSAVDALAGQIQPPRELI